MEGERGKQRVTPLIDHRYFNKTHNVSHWSRSQPHFPTLTFHAKLLDLRSESWGSAGIWLAQPQIMIGRRARAGADCWQFSSRDALHAPSPSVSEPGVLQLLQAPCFLSQLQNYHSSVPVFYIITRFPTQRGARISSCAPVTGSRFRSDQEQQLLNDVEQCKFIILWSRKLM